MCFRQNIKPNIKFEFPSDSVHKSPIWSTKNKAWLDERMAVGVVKK